MYPQLFPARMYNALARRFVWLLPFTITVLLGAYAQAQENVRKASALEPVAHARLAKGTAEYSDWLMYGGN